MRELRSHGVTLVELLVVVSIIGVVAVVATPILSTADPQRLDYSAAEMAGAIRFARSEAVRSGVPHGFNLEPAQQRIRVFRADTGTTPPTPVYDVYHPVSKKLYDIQLGDGLYPAVDGITVAPIFAGACTNPSLIIFNAQGLSRCGNPDNVLLRQSDVTFSSAGVQRVLQLQGISGRVTVQ